MASVLKEAYFHDEQAAFEVLEKIMWPNGPTCPHCKATDRLNRLKDQRTKPSKKHPQGKPVRGLWKCYHCRGQFTVRKGTVFESSHLELHQWFQAAFLMCSSKKGVSANQLHRTLGCTLKTAWFVGMRLREAMKTDTSEPLGGNGKIVESDETFWGRREGHMYFAAFHHKMKVMSLVERGGPVRSFRIERLRHRDINKIIAANVKHDSRLMTDAAKHYRTAPVAEHQAVDHGKTYVVGECHTNTLEGFFSIFKRGMRGIYQHCDEKHLHRYLAEFDFRYNNRVALGVDDVSRTTRALQGARGKRLTYQ